MGLSSKKTTQTTNQNQTQNATTTPLPPPQANTMLNDLTARIGAFGNVDPQSLVAGPSPLMQDAWGRASTDLGGWQPQNGAASILALSGGLAGPNLAGRQPQSANPLYGGAYLQGGQEPGRSSSLPLPANDGGLGLSPVDPAQAWLQGGAGAYTYAPPQIPGVTIGTPNQATPAQLGPAPVPQATAFGGAQLGPAPQGQATSFTAPQLAQAVGYNAPQMNAAGLSLGAAPAASAGNFGAAPQAGAVTLDPAAQAARAQVAQAAQAGQVNVDPIERMQSASLLDNLQSYMDPFIGNVVNTSLADFDTEAGRVRAQQAAAGARNGAFGGSRFALREAQTEGELSRARAALDAGLRSQAFSTGAGLSATDAAARQAASATNSAYANQRAALQAQLEAARQAGNAAEVNRLAGLQAQLDAQNSIANAGFLNDRSIAQGGITRDINLGNANNATQLAAARGRAETDASIASGGFARDYGVASLDAQTRAALANLDWQGRAAEFGAGAENTRNLAQGGYDFQSASQNAQAANNFGLANLDWLGRFGLQQGDYAQQAGLQSNDWQNRMASQGADIASQYGLQQGAFNQQTGMANTGWLNDFLLQQAGLDQTRNLTQAGLNSDAAQFAAASNNNMSQFNASQRDNALARQLQAAGLLGNLGSDYGNQTRADIGLLGELGQQQYGVDQAQRTAPLAQLDAISRLYGNIPWNIFTGQNVSGTSNTSGTSKTTQTGSVFDSLLALGSLAMPFIKPSDRAFKTDMEPAGEQKGYRLHRYRYRWDDPERPKRIGVMADEIEESRPDAIQIINGMRYVDYGALGLAHLVEA